MTRREFMAAVSAAGLAESKVSASTPPVHYAKPNPYDAVVKYVEPGSDEFKGEKDAVELRGSAGADLQGHGGCASGRLRPRG